MKISLHNYLSYIFFWTQFYFPNIYSGNETESRFKKKRSLIDPKFLLTFQLLFLVDRFGFYFEAISPWYHAIALLENYFSWKILPKELF